MIWFVLLWVINLNVYSSQNSTSNSIDPNIAIIMDWCVDWRVTTISCQDSEYACTVGSLLRGDPETFFTLRVKEAINGFVAASGLWGFNSLRFNWPMNNPAYCTLMGVQPLGTFNPTRANIFFPWDCNNQAGEIPSPPGFAVTDDWTFEYTWQVDTEKSQKGNKIVFTVTLKMLSNVPYSIPYNPQYCILVLNNK
jgi:hypothetical protein